MLKVLKYITAYFLVLLILIASVNISVTKMTCLLSGKVKYSLEKIEDCSSAKGENTISNKCCDFDKITLDYDYDTLVKVTSFESLSFLAIFTKTISIGFGRIILPNLIDFYSNSSPPIGGYDLLKRIQVFRL
ncbi:MAG: hypothetical protein AB7O47_11710 [Flavobacteriales bacterium]